MCYIRKAYQTWLDWRMCPVKRGAHRGERGLCLIMNGEIPIYRKTELAKDQPANPSAYSPAMMREELFDRRCGHCREGATMAKDYRPDPPGDRCGDALESEPRHYAGSRIHPVRIGRPPATV